MDEVENNDVAQVVPVEEQVQKGVEKEPEEIPQDKNWRELNRAKKELERKTKMQEEFIEKLMQNQQQFQAAPVKQEVDELDAIADDDHLLKGQSKKLVRKEVEPLQKRIDDLEAKLQKKTQFDRYESLKRKYSDFDEVVNSETMALLEEQEPELAQTIVDLKDPYKIGMQTYKYIKALNLSEKVPQARRSKEIDKKLENNKKTVESPQAFDKRPMAQAFKMTDAEKTKLYEEMMYYASQAGSSL